MNKPSVDTNRMNDVIDDAEWAFWAIVAKAYPEAQSGDLSPMATIEFNAAIVTAVTHWLELNADPQESEHKVTEIMLHRIEYFYTDGITLTDCDAEHIAYSISQGVSEGVQFEPDESTVHLYWKINNNPDA